MDKAIKGKAQALGDLAEPISTVPQRRVGKESPLATNFKRIARQAVAQGAGLWAVQAIVM